MGQTQSEIFDFRPISPTRIGSALSDTVEKFAPEGDRYVRAVSVNNIVLVEAGYNAAELGEILLVLSKVHPNRTFLVVLDEELKDIRVEYSALCHGVSAKEHVCTEIIRVSAPYAKFPAVESIINANQITGIAAELFIYQLPRRAQALEDLADITDEILFSSALYDGDPAGLAKLAAREHFLVDLEWVRLGLWRDQLREVFDRPACLAELASLERVEVHGRGGPGRGIPAACLLMAGWLIGRLDLKIVAGKGSLFTLESEDERRVELVFSSAPEGPGAAVLELGMHFAGRSGEPKKGALSIRRREELGTQPVLETVVEFGEYTRIVKEFEDEGTLNLIKHYYFVGDSFFNYRKSLNIAVELNGSGK